MGSDESSDDYIVRKVREHGRQGTVTFIEEPEPEVLFCPIISVDDHALEPADLFSQRLPENFKSHAPFLGPGEDGAPWWDIDGVRVPILLLNGAVGRPMNEWGLVASKFEEFREGAWNPKARLRDMDLTGVWSSLCFGSVVFGFAGTRFSKMADPVLGLACLKAYNDWMIEEWCAADRDRFIPCQLPWLLDSEAAATEIYRNAERGFRAVSFSENPERLGFPEIYDRFWDPFFRACEETQTVVNLHVGSSGTTRIPSTSSHESVSTALFPVNGLEALVDWAYSGILLRFPKLTVALSEAGVSWVPMALERLDRAFRRSAGSGEGWPPGAPTPKEIVARNFVFTSIEDPSGFRMLDIIGDDKVMVETDYPHYDSTWPECQQMIRSEMVGLSGPVIRKLCYENAARIYRSPLPPLELIAASEVGLAN